MKIVYIKGFQKKINFFWLSAQDFLTETRLYIWRRFYKREI